MVKLLGIRFDDMVTVPGGRLLGEGTCGDACESSFRAEDGWEIIETTPGTFTLRAPHMARAYTVGGYGYGYFATEAEAVKATEPTAIGNWPVQKLGKKR